MALSGFGLNAAVQAFPAMYEFGRSLFGQDNASKAQAFKEKQAEAELALKQREMEDNAAYRAGVLRGQDYQNQTGRMQVRNTYDIGDRETRVRESLAPSQIQQNIASSGLAGAQTNRINTMTPWEAQEAQARIGYTGAQTNRINTMTPWEAQEAQSRIQLQGAQGGLIGAQTAASRDANNRANAEHPLRMRGLQADTNKAELANRWEQQYFDDEKRHQRFEADPFDRSLSPEDRRRVEIQRNIQFNPHAAEAVQAFDEASNRYVATGDAKAFSPEVVAAVGRGIQPLLDLNTNYAPGTLQFNGFEPVEGGVRVRLQKKTPDGRVEQTYLTEDRGNLSEGSNPKVFSGQELHQMLGGLREIAGAQANNPEYASLQQDMDQARKMSRNRVEYEHNLYTLRSQRAQNQRTAEKDAQSDADKAQKALEHAAAMRGALAKDALDELDAIHPISQMRPEEGKPTPQYQQLMQARARLDAAIRSATADAEPGELIKAHPTDVFNIPEVNKALNEYQDAYNRFQPPVEGDLGIQGAPPRPAQTGGFVNPRYPQGGGAAPLAQAAPNQGGSFQPASYRPQQPLAMPKNLQITGTAKQFGVERVDPSLMEGVKAAAQLWPGTVDLFSSGRAKTKRERGNHSSWHAIDVGLITPEGQYLPNHIKKKWHGGGSGAAHMYERFWQAAVLWAAQDDPSILNRFRWGGNFREQDYMHGDTLRGVGGKTTGAGTLFGGRDTRYGGGKTMPVQDLNALGRQLYGSAWRGIPGLQRMA